MLYITYASILGIIITSTHHSMQYFNDITVRLSYASLSIHSNIIIGIGQVVNMINKSIPKPRKKS